MKIWVAYLIPKQDLDFLLEDGLGALAVGLTEQQAIDNLKEEVEPENWEASLEYHRLYTEEKLL